ncbi:HK97 family phage prohead protease [Anaerofustis stercorihominis]|uniref:HK97 family phage prohead protease n=1 Tax=Anaerofustis stercorihominis TaxID=214853 RepID=UPI002673CD09|nr:HK97 family phage prohead protease [Anaerofustis stercorihominis]
MNKAIDFLRRNYHPKQPFTIRDGENGMKVITGKPIVFNQRADLGYFEEIIERGALNATDLTDVRFLVNHDTSKIPLARSRKNTANSTMQLMVEEDGLKIRVNLDVENNPEARSLISAVEREDITGMSFMFSIDDEEWENLDSDYPTRHIKSISRVIEVSAVTFPAYEGTSISARNKEALDNAKRAVETARKFSVDTEERALELEKIKNENLIRLGGI